MKKFILLFVVTIIMLSSPSFSGKKPQEKLDTDLEQEKAHSLLRPLSKPLTSTRGTTFYIPRTKDGYDLTTFPESLKQKKTSNNESSKIKNN